ncbi:Cyclic nucleotide-gated cation channel alpha-3 [Tetrabaena socialis]|uniref:Cyclic nucleotide-gated cation channel alpha-3 n=1 Tax=Tetrabaena socialis TaxID=47790 RepID=A0A2J8A136_9CHLO|nr:Cyclic nucleotide-gated cation channel alpha-3 [Tetrabaena socialis]|eukprot:PNH06237.1 Cyclic nucleotide-gated cation channel alpha-3 [Tetrabaena socialis]
MAASVAFLHQIAYEDAYNALEAEHRRHDEEVALAEQAHSYHVDEGRPAEGAETAAGRGRQAHLRRGMLTGTAMILISHWLACIWYLMYRFGGSEAAETWSFELAAANEPGQPTMLSYYLTTYYYSFLLLVGDNVPSYNNYERAFFVLVLIGGTFFYSAVVGQMATLVATMNVAVNRHGQKLLMVQDALRYAGVPESHSESVQRYYEYLQARSHPGAEGLHFLQASGELPHGLHLKLCHFLHRRSLSKVPLFQDCEEGFLSALSLRIRMISLSPKEIIFCIGDVGREMYIIRKGCVAVTSNKKEMWGLLAPGEIFGEVALLSTGKRTANCTALGFVDLSVLTGPDLQTKSKMWMELSEADYEEEEGMGDLLGLDELGMPRDDDSIGSAEPPSDGSSGDGGARRRGVEGAPAGAGVAARVGVGAEEQDAEEKSPKGAEAGPGAAGGASGGQVLLLLPGSRPASAAAREVGAGPTAGAPAEGLAAAAAAAASSVTPSPRRPASRPTSAITGRRLPVAWTDGAGGSGSGSDTSNAGGGGGGGGAGGGSGGGGGTAGGGGSREASGAGPRVPRLSLELLGGGSPSQGAEQGVGVAEAAMRADGAAGHGHGSRPASARRLGSQHSGGPRPPAQLAAPPAADSSDPDASGQAAPAAGAANAPLPPLAGTAVSTLGSFEAALQSLLQLTEAQEAALARLEERAERAAAMGGAEGMMMGGSSATVLGILMPGLGGGGGGGLPYARVSASQLVLTGGLGLGAAGGSGRLSVSQQMLGGEARSGGGGGGAAGASVRGGVAGLARGGGLGPVGAPGTKSRRGSLTLGSGSSNAAMMAAAAAAVASVGGGEEWLGGVPAQRSARSRMQGAVRAVAAGSRMRSALSVRGGPHAPPSPAAEADPAGGSLSDVGVAGTGDGGPEGAGGGAGRSRARRSSLLSGGAQEHGAAQGATSPGRLRSALKGGGSGEPGNALGVRLAGVRINDDDGGPSW